MSTRTRLRSRIRSILNRSDLDVVIPPEIQGDAFAEAITNAASDPAVRTAIEIGASGGAGSTRALLAGLRGKVDVTLVCLELSEPRFHELSHRYAEYPWVHCLNESSVPIDAFPDEQDVETFIDQHGGSALYGNPAKEVVRWLRQDRAYIEQHALLDQGIHHAKAVAGVETFDFVLIDGSEFTGWAELNELIGARFIFLDDVRTFKNHANRERLLVDPRYDLTEEDLNLRNGYSAFRLKNTASSSDSF